MSFPARTISRVGRSKRLPIGCSMRSVFQCAALSTHRAFSTCLLGWLVDREQVNPDRVAICPLMFAAMSAFFALAFCPEIDVPMEKAL